jgi:flagellar biogenesis protein FliO
MESAVTVTMMILIGADVIPAGMGSVSGEIIEYVKLIGTLAAVIGFAVLVLRVWASKLAGGPVARSGPLQVAWRLNLEPRKTLYIVRAASGYLLLATSDAGVQLLTQLDTEEVEAAIQERSSRPSTGFEFAAVMRSLRREQPGGRVE